MKELYLTGKPSNEHEKLVSVLINKNIDIIHSRCSDDSEVYQVFLCLGLSFFVNALHMLPETAHDEWIKIKLETLEKHLQDSRTFKKEQFEDQLES